MLLRYGGHRSAVREVVLDRPLRKEDEYEGMHILGGSTVGRWEGDTLVVETTHFRAGGTVDGYSETYRGVSENLKITERFTPLDANTLRWEVRAEDPTTWVSPWAIAMPLKRDPEQAVFEYACHEGNFGLRNILSAARAAERTGAGQ